MQRCPAGRGAFARAVAIDDVEPFVCEDMAAVLPVGNPVLGASFLFRMVAEARVGIPSPWRRGENDRFVRQAGTRRSAMHETRNDMPNNVRKAVVELLQETLHDTIDLAGQAKQAHWNVKGPSFIALHELFDRIYEESSGHADMIAERIVALGGQALGTVRAVADGSSLPEYPLAATAQEDHVRALASALAHVGRKVRAAIDKTTEIGDQASADLFTELSRALDKQLWLVEAHVSPVGRS